jgi:hypothetical protein
MTTDETQKEIQDQTGGLAESARHHLAYERLSKQIAASENAARLVLDALARAGQGADASKPETTP